MDTMDGARVQLRDLSAQLDAVTQSIVQIGQNAQVLGDRDGALQLLSTGIKNNVELMGMLTVEVERVSAMRPIDPSVKAERDATGFALLCGGLKKNAQVLVYLADETDRDLSDTCREVGENVLGWVSHGETQIPIAAQASLGPT